jgi:uncharacterized protein
MTIGSRFLASLAKLPPAHTHDVAVERAVSIKMPDGAVLLADRWYPTNPGAGSPPPTVLLRSPYGRQIPGLAGRLFAERGYQVVIQSCRGTFGSGGDWNPFRHEQSDGRATLEWIAGQPWFDGQLVTFGPSYLGVTQWAVAEDAPDFVKAMALTVTAKWIRDAIVYPGESFALETALTWVNEVEHQERGILRRLVSLPSGPKVVRAAAGVLPLNVTDRAAVNRPVDFYQDWLAHNEPGDAWWGEVDFGQRLGAVPPSTLVGGWYDLFLPAQVADFVALRAAGRQSRLTIGPWTHGSPGGIGTAMRDALDFYDEQLKGRPSRRGPVRLFVMGSKRWEEFAEWPPPANQQQWHLGRNGTLSTDLPAEGPPDTYRYDPADPTPGIGGPSLLAQNAGAKDQSERESRSDVLTYTSPVLQQDMTVIGPLSATLFLRSSLEHTDFSVRLCDVSPKGKSINISDGILRLTPGSVTKDSEGVFTLQINMWPTANTFKAGHRVRLQVASGAHPLFARNPGSGEPLASATTLHVADQEVWHDPGHPSSITLPVVRLGS